MQVKIKASQVSQLTAALLQKQGYICPLCKAHFTRDKKTPALDHDHNTGFVRDVLCLNCNGMEGRVFNIATRSKQKLTQTAWLSNLVAYWHRHSEPRHGGILHHTHKSPEEKRLLKNAKARAKRASLKA